MKNEYIVFCDATNGNPTWDTLVGVFKTFDEAKHAADIDWMYTSEHDRKNRITYVSKVELQNDSGINDALEYALAYGYTIEYTAVD